jgi:hypothetical protein
MRKEVMFKSIRYGVLVILLAGQFALHAKAQAASCYQLAPKTSGWKYVEVPEGYSLPAEYEQFRIRKEVVVWNAWPMGKRIVYSKIKKGWRHLATLHLDGATSSALRFEFWPPLERRKVSVVGYAAGIPYRIIIREASRHSGKYLDLNWRERKMERIEVVIHTHFKKPPEIEQVWIGRKQILEETVVPEGFRDERYLFFRSLDGSSAELCSQVGGFYQIYDLPQMTKPVQVVLGDAFEKKHSSHRKIVGIFVAIALVILILIVLRIALKESK